MAEMDTAMRAAEAGLREVTSGSPGYRRVRRGRGFSYVDNEGRVVNGAVRKRIGSLAIPPAWDQVWISRDPMAHILATGHDQAGRKQYIYHPKWEDLRDDLKFERLGLFGQKVSGLRRRLVADLRRRGQSREKVVALAVAVLDRTLVRVGNRRYAVDNQSYGLTTLTSEHIAVDGLHVHLEFAGKGGADRQLAFSDRHLSQLIGQCQELGGQTLFSYETAGGGVASVSSTDVNEYLADAMNGPFTAKDFRTWGASSVVTGEIASSTEEDPRERLMAAVDVAAERLGNSREVCRDSYVHPILLSDEAGSLVADAWARSRAGKWLDRPESALRRVLDESNS